MSRSGYSDDCENLNLWRGAVDSAIHGKRGQAFLKELAAAMDAMPEKRLVQNALEQDGEVCALGCVGKARGVSLSAIDPDESRQVAKTFGVAHALACEIMYENDEGGSWPRRDGDETPSQRWQRMRDWVKSQIKAEGY